MSTVEYDAANQVLSTKNPLGIVTTYTYDKNGNLESLKDARGGTTSWTYDLMDRVREATDQVGHSTTYTYNALDAAQVEGPRRPLQVARDAPFRRHALAECHNPRQVHALHLPRAPAVHAPSSY